MTFSISRRGVLAGVATATLLKPLGAGADSDAQAGPSLARLAARGGRYFGAAARFDQIESERGLGPVLARECSQLTPEIHMKWDAIEWHAGQHSFQQADGLVRFAREHGLKVRGHTLLWEQSTPAWARARAAAGDWTPIRSHFETMLGRYGEVEEWDVVNEPIDTETGKGGLRRNSFHRGFGPSYLTRALHEARELAPKASLLINDYGFDYDNPVEEARRRRLLKLLADLKAEGTPLDGIGIQAHLDLSKGPLKSEILEPFFSRIADLGLYVVISELDVKEHDLAAPLAERDRRVADQVKQYLDIALAQPNVRGVVTWGLSDRHSWLSEAGADPLNRGLPYDAGLARKPMYWAMRDSFLRAHDA